MGDEDRLTHLDGRGSARMVDVGGKPESLRRAIAGASIRFSAGVLPRVMAGDLPKGAVLETARLAGVAGAKRTSDLIPLCHPLRLTSVRVDFEPDPPDRLRIEAEVCAVDRTGVEMEAMVAASVAALAIYDMVKAVDRSMEVESVRLLLKEGGKSGRYQKP